MSALVRIRTLFGSALVCLALTVSACSSSGKTDGAGSGGANSSDSGVTVAQIANKLKNEPRIAAVKTQLGNQAGKLNDVIDCVARTMHKDVDQKDLKAYVDGQKKITDLKQFASQVQKDATSCIKSVLG